MLATAKPIRMPPLPPVGNGVRAIDRCIFDCGYLATELLASPVGVAGLSRYYMLLETEMMPIGTPEADIPRPGWRTSFKQAFGTTTEEFCRLFGEHKAAGFPEVTIPKPG